jgi:hypothetical protein
MASARCYGRARSDSSIISKHPLMTNGKPAGGGSYLGAAPGSKIAAFALPAIPTSDR